MIETRHLSYSVGKKEILHDISFSAEEGCITGIIGPNGSGKSTLLAHLSGHIRSEGAVFLAGTPIETIPRRTYARTVAVMLQQREDLPAELSADDLVLTGRYPYKRRFMDYTRADRDAARRAMEAAGASELSGKRIGSLSGGERQRLFIAKAFAQEPRLLLMDEPTNHLDVRCKLDLMERLRDFRGTAVVVLHDLSLAARYCERLAVMKDGRLLAAGAAEDIATPARLSELFGVPFYSARHGTENFIYY